MAHNDGARDVLTIVSKFLAFIATCAILYFAYTKFYAVPSTATTPENVPNKARVIDVPSTATTPGNVPKKARVNDVTSTATTPKNVPKNLRASTQTPTEEHT
eukprot:141881_1